MFILKNYALVLITVFAFSGLSSVHAQGDTGTAVATATGTATRTATATGTAASNADPCLDQCANQAARTAGCTSAMDVSCICSSGTFNTDVSYCIQNNCPASVASQAAALQTQECTAGTSATGTGGTSRNLASTGASTRFTFSGTIQHTTATANGTSVSGASGSQSNLAVSGSEFTLQMNSLLSLASVLVGIIFGTLAV